MSYVFKNDTEYEIYSDITNFKLDNNKALYIEGVGFCSKNELIGEKKSLEKIFDDMVYGDMDAVDTLGDEIQEIDSVNIHVIDNDSKVRTYQIHKIDDKFYLGKTILESMSQRKYFQPITSVNELYELKNGVFTTKRPMFKKVDLEEYFKSVLDGKEASKTLILNHNDTICCYSDRGKTYVELSWMKERCDFKTLFTLEVYQDEKGEMLSLIDNILNEKDTKNEFMQERINFNIHNTEKENNMNFLKEVPSKITIIHNPDFKIKPSKEEIEETMEGMDNTKKDTSEQVTLDDTGNDIDDSFDDTDLF